MNGVIRYKIVNTEEEAKAIEAEWEFQNSIETARRLGVPEEQILHSIDEIDKYFMN